MFCPKCGAQNPDTGIFCIGCGSQLAQPQQNPYGQPQQNQYAQYQNPYTQPRQPYYQQPPVVVKSSGKTVGIIIAIIVAIVLVALVVVISNLEFCDECGKLVTDGYKIFGRVYCEDCAW